MILTGGYTVLTMRDLFIDGNRIHKVIHLIAEDEYRANFDLTTALSDTLDTDTLQPHVIEGNIEEILIPGAHSDIGGGYPSTLSHDIGNHSLAQISLHFMYHKAREYHVPLIPIDKVITSQAHIGKKTTRVSMLINN